jgi:hypothetical protein
MAAHVVGNHETALMPPRQRTVTEIVPVSMI